MKTTTRMLLTCAAIGAAGGVLLIPANNIAAAISVVMPLAYAAMTGIWLIPFVFVLALLRRPGVAILAALFASVITSFTTVYGASSLLTNLMIAIALEIPFAISLYRYWRAWVFYVGAAVFGLLYSFTAMAALGVDAWSVPMQATFVLVIIASEIAATWLGLLLARRVERTGVVRGLARPRAARPARPAKVPAA
ncbi:ECF transporter S component [Agromyces atrinae]|uniref:Energy-coupling factor transport system substrate-specific component n=1 Tax=Agromyces atrinae TaxID=592376 RepID=A0A4V1R220_9MICO|nr:ECF transporter S component [Agromyces atrinae]NYD68321.1 energy-coupling factor transport system substrate-specific component [Agromyces atrinae]RXZ85626.1 hypothetical protein ESP50_14115 [Agromyces atrinae]